MRCNLNPISQEFFDQTKYYSRLQYGNYYDTTYIAPEYVLCSELFPLYWLYVTDE
jgi:hypothetical protein